MFQVSIEHPEMDGVKHTFIVTEEYLRSHFEHEFDLYVGSQVREQIEFMIEDHKMYGGGLYDEVPTCNVPE